MPELFEGLFRESAGRLVSILTRALGARHLDLAEECVQDALIKAMEKWPFHGVPRNPQGWLLQAARNRAIDVIRRDQKLVRQLADVEAIETNPSPPVDEELGMVFLCCHPSLSRESQVALVLKTVGGLGVREIARAYLTAENTIAQRLVRAKNRLKEEQVEFDLPQALAESQTRLDSVLEALYLLYNEGYAMLAPEFSREAIRLSRMLVRNPATALPQSHALLALMLLQSAREDARTDAQGSIVVLESQNRALWNHSRIAEGMHHLDLSANGQELTRYHLEAGIASQHAISPTWESTNWRAIANLYEQLERLHPSPVVRLNRAVSVGQLEGPASGLAMLQEMQSQLDSYQPYHAAMGYFTERLGDTTKAVEHFRKAQAYSRTGIETAFFEGRIASLLGGFLRTDTTIH